MLAQVKSGYVWLGQVGSVCYILSGFDKLYQDMSGYVR